MHQIVIFNVSISLLLGSLIAMLNDMRINNNISIILTCIFIWEVQIYFPCLSSKSTVAAAANEGLSILK